jgi:hypothetical protein
LYRIDADAARLRVFDGEALVTSGSDTVTARKGRQVEFGAVLSAASFDSGSNTDAFSRWSARRAQYLATANVSAARSAGGSGFTSSQWAWNPWYGMFTYVPYRGYGYSPYGWAIYSPVTVINIYVPQRTSFNSGAFSGVSQPSYNSGASYSAPSAGSLTSAGASSGGGISSGGGGGGAPAAAPASAGHSGGHGR